MSLKHNIRDNIGLACFGRETKLLLPPFADYDGGNRMTQRKTPTCIKSMANLIT
jgi:hypothetical protein